MLTRVSLRLFERDSGLPTLAAGGGNHAHNGTTCAAPLPDAPAVSSLLLVACLISYSDHSSSLSQCVP